MAYKTIKKNTTQKQQQQQRQQRQDNIPHCTTAKKWVLNVENRFLCANLDIYIVCTHASFGRPISM